jgi:hypothetical protein
MTENVPAFFHRAAEGGKTMLGGVSDQRLDLEASAAGAP